MPVKWRLADVLKAKGLTGYQLARTLEIDQATVYRILAAKELKHIDARTLAKFCAALDCQPGDLLVYVPEKKKR